MKKVGGGWCSTEQPSVEMGRPSNESGFQKFNSEGIDVYLYRGVIPRGNELKIRLNKMLWIKSLIVEGVSM